MPVLIVDDDEWGADDIRALRRTADLMTTWKRAGDKRIAELEAVLQALVDGYYSDDESRPSLEEWDDARAALSTAQS